MNGMAPIKFIGSQAHSIRQYKNVRTKVLKCRADIFFNRQCLARKITPNYANIKIPVTSAASRVMQGKVHNIRLKDEVNYLYLKKEKLNKELYSVHLKAAKGWGNSWFIIVDSIRESINYEMERKYETMSQKLQKLKEKKHRLPPLNITKTSTPGSLITQE
jgi:hypothetical protein